MQFDGKLERHSLVFECESLGLERKLVITLRLDWFIYLKRTAKRGPRS